MEINEQKQIDKNHSISPLAAEPTYGERVYDFIFNNLINFWINLATSAAFTYWVTHAQKPVKMGKIEIPAPSELQQKFASFAYKLPPMRVFGEKETQYDPSSKRGRAANNAANTFTLVMAGHPIMIGSVWLGAKVKAPLVKFFNRMHYGDEAMENPDLKARHLAITAEERPTLFGAVVGRLGTIVATQLTTYTIGNPTNMLAWAGKKIGMNFPGMDHIAEVTGDHVGMAVQEMLPVTTGKIDKVFAHDSAGNKRFDWSVAQLQANPALAHEPYHNATQHFSKYLAQDVLYSAVTAASINPALNFLKQYIPGMTYRPKLPPHKEERALMLQDELHLKTDPFKNRLAVNANDNPLPSANDNPQVKISHAAYQGAGMAEQPASEVIRQ